MSTKYAHLLRNLPFLEGTGPDVVEYLAGAVREKVFEPGDVILKEGSTGREMYLIVEGMVEVWKGDGADATSLGVRGPGTLFGEMAFLEEQPRFATIQAVEPTRLLEFPEQAMRTALAEHPELLLRTIQVLSARIRESDLQMIADLQRKNQELARAYRELKEAQAALVEKERLEREMELAREIQQSILPHVFPQVPGFSCAARSRPARQVGGDFYDVFPLSEGRVGLVMADVSDKGIPAALFMALTRSLIRAEGQRLASPRETLLRVNRLLLEMSQTGLFVTVFYGVLDLRQNTLCYVRAGHDYPLVFRSETGECSFLGGSGIVLGLLDGIDLEEVSVDLGPGDVLALYTDGVTEAHAPTGELFGEDRLRDALCGVGEHGAQAVCDSILAQVDRFQGGATQHDDTALLVVKLEAAA
jgi:serine phosphatase RsbU (regulator of sigma subunit)